MKAFLTAVVFYGVAAAATGFILEGVFARQSVDAFSTEGAAPGHHGDANERGWNY
ncbi:MAG TPA: hypothetical protein VED40_12280 [Azospirillaceae bacterium]|nr:hypothetical protein [Azospirillaceae bacterium]